MRNTTTVNNQWQPFDALLTARWNHRREIESRGKWWKARKSCVWRERTECEREKIDDNNWIYSSIWLCRLPHFFPRLLCSRRQISCYKFTDFGANWIIFCAPVKVKRLWDIFRVQKKANKQTNKFHLCMFHLANERTIRCRHCEKCIARN